MSRRAPQVLFFSQTKLLPRPVLTVDCEFSLGFRNVEAHAVNKQTNMEGSQLSQNIVNENNIGESGDRTLTLIVGGGGLMCLVISTVFVCFWRFRVSHFLFFEALSFHFGGKCVSCSLDSAKKYISGTDISSEGIKFLQIEPSTQRPDFPGADTASSRRLPGFADPQQDWKFPSRGLGSEDTRPHLRSGTVAQGARSGGASGDARVEGISCLSRWDPIFTKHNTLVLDFSFFPCQFCRRLKS